MYRVFSDLAANDKCWLIQILARIALTNPCDAMTMFTHAAGSSLSKIRLVAASTTGLVALLGGEGNGTRNWLAVLNGSTGSILWRVTVADGREDGQLYNPKSMCFTNDGHHIAGAGTMHSLLAPGHALCLFLICWLGTSPRADVTLTLSHTHTLAHHQANILFTCINVIHHHHYNNHLSLLLTSVLAA